MVPETVLQSPETPQYITPKSNTKNNRIVATKGKSIKSTANTSLPQPTKVSKRRSSSLTSELEIQIEIEESTKRAKVCLTITIFFFHSQCQVQIYTDSTTRTNCNGQPKRCKHWFDPLSESYAVES